MAQSISFTSKHHLIEISRTNETKSRYILTVTTTPLRSKKLPVFHFKCPFVAEIDIYTTLWRLTALVDSVEFDWLVISVTDRLMTSKFGGICNVTLPEQSNPNAN